jgi:hypothetical protein
MSLVKFAITQAPSPPSTDRGEGWGEGEAFQWQETLRRADVLPPHPTLSPKKAWGRGLEQVAAGAST